jgi:hypothetical protein
MQLDLFLDGREALLVLNSTSLSPVDFMTCCWCQLMSPPPGTWLAANRGVDIGLLGRARNRLDTIHLTGKSIEDSLKTLCDSGLITKEDTLAYAFDSREMAGLGRRI